LDCDFALRSVLYFFFILLRPPRSTLFPYTTPSDLQILSPVVNIASDVRWGRTEETYGEDPFLSSEMGVAFVSAFEKMNIITTPKDRKSTRLNSSHVKISYAVFCLKKKKKKKLIQKK